MKITKTTSKTYEIKFFPDSPIKIKLADFVKTRKFYGLNTSKFEKCFCCNRKFKDDEIPVVISVSGEGNRFACQECSQKEKDGAI